jgi:hypothetical protein
MNQPPSRKSPIDKLRNPRKRIPTRLQGSNSKTTYSDLSALFGVIVSYLLVVVSFLSFCAIACAMCVQAGIYFFQLKTKPNGLTPRKRNEGNANTGHEGAEYGTTLSAQEKDAIVEYLKTF